MITKIYPILCTIFVLFIYFESLSQVNQVPPTMEESFPVCKIGAHVFMAKNLSSCVFQNGDSIFHARTDKEWFEAQKNKIPAWRYVNDDSTTLNTYGRMYNWFAVNDSRGLAPIGWHIPSKQEMETLIQEIGQHSSHLKSISGWENHSGGDNRSNFNAYPCGYYKNTGRQQGQGIYALFWTQTIEKKYYPSYFIILTKEKDLYTGRDLEGCGMAVRCIKNE